MGQAISLVYGDGIGPEVVSATQEIIGKSGVQFEWREVEMGLRAYEKSGCALPEKTLESIRKTGVALKGPTTTPIGSGHVSANVQLRKALDLFACVRPVKNLPGAHSVHNNVDLVIFRENTEGLYSGKELEIQPGCVISLRVMSKKACLRIAQAAFKYAQENKRKKVCAAHKANILKLGDGLFLDCVREVSQDYPNIILEEVIVDALSMHLVTRPANFDILVLENMFGDIISDLSAGLIGGLGLVPGANIGEKCAVFEAVHGSAPDIAGKNIANPTAMILSGAMLLRHVGKSEAADKIESALNNTLKEKSCKTKDLGGGASTKDFVGAILQNI